jgi:hypothetical protein
MHQVLPVASLVRLKHGNLGRKGSARCVWQKPCLISILPNLPRGCRVICIKRKKAQGNAVVELVSCKFEHRRIEAILRRLRAANHEAFQFEISDKKLAAWPETGNLAGISVTIFENDEEDADDGGSSGNGNAGRVSDEGDLGPAPLQNAVEPNETLTGTVDCNTESEDPL